MIVGQQQAGARGRRSASSVAVARPVGGASGSSSSRGSSPCSSSSTTPDDAPCRRHDVSPTPRGRQRTSATCCAPVARSAATCSPSTGRRRRSGRPRRGRRACARSCSILLASRFSMWMAWGPELTFFCNDAYRRDTLGNEVPVGARAPGPRGVGRDLARHRPAHRDRDAHRRGDLGRGAAAVPRAQRLHRGDLPHVLLQPADRRRRRIAGMLCVVSEDTERVIGERRHGDAARPRLGRRRRVAARHEALGAARRHLGADAASLPFTLTYLFDEDGRRAPRGRHRRRGRPRGGAGDDRRRRRAAGLAGRPSSPRATRSWSSSTGASPTCRPARGTSRRRTRSSSRCPQQGSRPPVRLPRRRAEPLPARRRRATAVHRPVAGQLAARRRERARLRGRAPPRREARRARPGQDRRSSPTSATSCARR